MFSKCGRQKNHDTSGSSANRSIQRNSPTAGGGAFLVGAKGAIAVIPRGASGAGDESHPPPDPNHLRESKEDPMPKIRIKTYANISSNSWTAARRTRNLTT